MERGPLIAIAGGKANAKTIPLALISMTLALFLLAYGISEIRFMMMCMDLALCDLRRKLEQIRTVAPASSYTATVKLTPETQAPDASSLTAPPL